MTPLYLSLGTNLGDKPANLRRAVALLEERLHTPHAALSSFLETAPWGYESPNAFLNACIRFDLDLPATRPEARRILALCKDIENEMGRIQRAPGEGYKDRITKARSPGPGRSATAVPPGDSRCSRDI